MTPDEVNTLARQRYNATNDTFFSDAELYTLQWQAQTELALATNCIRKVYDTTTVASQQAYDKPTRSYAIKRVTYNGSKLYKITDREDDALTLNSATTTTTGTPQYYTEWGDEIYLRPIPDDALTLEIFSYDMPQTVSAVTTLDVPLRYHAQLSEFLLSKMAAKDKNLELAAYYAAEWKAVVAEAVKYERKFLRGDSFTHVQDEESLPVTIIGAT